MWVTWPTPLHIDHTVDSLINCTYSIQPVDYTHTVYWLGPYHHRRGESTLISVCSTDQETVIYYYEERIWLSAVDFLKLQTQSLFVEILVDFLKPWNFSYTIQEHSLSRSRVSDFDVAGPSIALRRDDRSICANLDRLFESPGISPSSVNNSLPCYLQLEFKNHQQTFTPHTTLENLFTYPAYDSRKSSR